MSEEKYIPKSKLAQWFDSRLPLLTLSHHLQSYPTPKNLNYWWTFGGILTFCLITQIVTGLVLAMHYVAHVDHAFESIEHIMRDVNYGWLIRYVHANGASMFFLAVYIHIFRALFYGSYKAPREVIWIIGLLIYILMMATAFMGYVLPWGQMSFWGATVITNLFSAIPLVGESITTWLWGGYSVDNPTLNRFYSLHYLLPFLIFGLVVLHIWALHVPGNNNPIGIDVKKNSNETMPFHPYMVMKDLFALLLFITVFLWFVFFAPNVLGHPDNYIEANPLVTPAHIVPEWYLLPFYAILRAIPSKLGGVIFMFAAIFILMLLPWLDTSKVRSATFRPIYKNFFWLLVFVVLLLGYLGAKAPEGIYLILSRLGTTYYFAHFLIVLPLLGRYEKTDPLPQSISDPVLNKPGVLDKFKKAAAEYEGENVGSFK
jgi:ubiquinol-cytochrome c reductase cytochrome b/c1 subunit